MRFKNSMKQIVAFILTLVMTIGLVGCGGESSEVNIYDLSDEAQELVTNPTIEYVVAALDQIESIVGIEEGSNGEDFVTIFFSSNIVDQSEWDADESVAEKGTQSGGSIDIFETHEDAVERDKYLQGFDGSALFDSGSHTVVGTLVVRASSKLDEDKQQELTKQVIEALTSGDITDEMIASAMEKYGITKKVEMQFAHDYVYYKQYTEIQKKLEEIGFTSIDYNVSEMDYSHEKHFDGAVVGVSIDGDTEFEEGTLFELGIPVIINYVKDMRIAVPKSNTDCEVMSYQDVVKLFTDAGFKNVTAQGQEVEYTTSVANGSVIIVSVNDNAVFAAGDKFRSDVPVIIYYRVMKAPVQSQTSSSNQTTDNNSSSSNSNNSSNTSSGSEKMVWIPQSGSKYHSHSGCSNMKNPTKVTKEKAESMGYEPCKRCH